MWVPRTSEEAFKWRASAAKKAESRGWTVGLVGWSIATLALATGWRMNLSSGIAVERNHSGNFWLRLLLFGLISSPVIFIAYRIESRKALRNDLARTICPTCDIAAENNAGATCQCGGKFVPASSVRWVED